MSGKTSFSDILAALPSLSLGGLEAVEALARTLRANGQRRRGGTPRGLARKAKAEKPPKGKESPYKAEPLYQKFRAAEKAMLSLLKERKTSLKEALEKYASEEAITNFVAIRDSWLRRKKELTAPGPASAAPASASSSSSSSSSSKAEEKKKEDK